MTDQELKELTEKIRKSTPEEGARFGIRQYGGGPDESFIEANRAGLILYATQLLDAAAKIDHLDRENNQKTITLNNDTKWMDEYGDIYIHYVQPVNLIPDGKVREARPVDKVLNIVFPLGCFAVLILCIIAMIKGFIVLFS